MKRRNLFAIAVALLLVLGACSSDEGGDSAELAELRANLAAAQEALDAATTDMAEPATVNVVQGGDFTAFAELEPVEPSGWETPEAIRGGMRLLAQYDSSGPDAWDVAAHPMVFISSEGVAKNPLTADQPVQPGFYIMDAYTKEVIIGGLFEIGEMTDASHGVTTSPDGKWAYFGTRTTIDEVPTRILMIVNVRTMKLDKVIYYPGSSFVHHMMGFTDIEGNDRVVITVNRCPQFFLDPNDDNRVARTITTEDAPLCGHTYPTVDPTGQYFYQSADGSYYGGDEVFAGVTKIDLTSTERNQGGTGYQGETFWGFGHGGRVIGIVHTADGKYTYVTDAHNSEIFKFDNETGEILGKTSAGVAGPYGACLNWDETRLYSVGKGEGSHNHGAVLGLLDTTTFRQSRELHNMPIWLGGSASSVDHCVVHPDPEVNELWVTNMNGWEVIVLDMDTNEVTDYIPTPNGGDTHGGAFVEYDADWNGVLLADMGGPHTEEIWELRRTLAAAAAAAAG